MSFEVNKKFWREFIEVYKENSCLWNQKSVGYTNRRVKNRAYERLAIKLREIKPGADKNYVIKKLNTLRASFRRQYRKMKETKQFGRVEAAPTLWYYDLLMFTVDPNDDRGLASSLQKFSDDKTGEMADYQDDKVSYDENKHFWKEFIEIYRESSCLWDSKSENYSNRQMKDRAYQKLSIKAREINSSADKDFVIRKLNSLKASVRRQHRQLKEMREYGKEDAEPTLWYYDLLLFTLGHRGCKCPPQGRTLATSTGNPAGAEEAADIQVDVYPQSLCDTNLLTFNSLPATDSLVCKTEMSPVQEGIWEQEDEEPSQSRVKAFDEESENEWEILGKSVGLQFKKLEPQQAIIAQKLVSDVLFHAKMGRLLSESRIQLQQINIPYWVPSQNPPPSQPTQWAVTGHMSPPFVPVQSQYPLQQIFVASEQQRNPVHIQPQNTPTPVAKIKVEGSHIVD